MRYIISIIIVAIVGLGIGGLFGFDYGLSQCPEPETVYLEVESPDGHIGYVDPNLKQQVFPPGPEVKIVEVIEVIEVPVIKEVNRWRPYPQHFKEFDSEEHLRTWCEGQLTVLLNGDCDDYAEYLQRKALSQGYLMSVRLTQQNWHMINLTMIGNDIFYIEPQPTYFRVWRVCSRD